MSSSDFTSFLITAGETSRLYSLNVVLLRRFFFTSHVFHVSVAPSPTVAVKITLALADVG